MEISIFEEINDGVNHTATERHEGRHFKERPVPVGVESEIEHEIVDLTDGVADDVTDADYQERLYGVLSGQLEFIRL